MVWFVAGLLGLGLFVGALYWLAYAKPRQIGKALAAVLIVALSILTAILFTTGRLAAALPALASALAALWQAKGLARAITARTSWLGRGAGAGSGRTSTVRTAMLKMSLDHDSGDLDGTIEGGSFAGRRLSGLDADELHALHAELAREDADGLRLLEAWLPRVHGSDWRRGDEHAASPPPSGAMSEDEALALLGLEKGADAATIKAAHKALMKKLHPDHGGSAYFAAKINEAKDVLLGR